MGLIIRSLKDFLDERMKTNAKVVSIDKKRDKYVIYISDGTSIESEALVLAIPAYEASKKVGFLDKNLSKTLDEIFYPAISVVCLGYKNDKIKHPLDGFGFLVPNRERRKILGTLWDSSIFPNRAPEGYVLLRNMIGGARMSDISLQDADKQIGIVMSALKDIMGINGEPDFTRIYIHEKGIPQYSLGHERRLEVIDKAVFRFKRLYITGNAYRGIGVNDCIENSFNLAERIVREIEQ